MTEQRAGGVTGSRAGLRILSGTVCTALYDRAPSRNVAFLMGADAAGSCTDVAGARQGVSELALGRHCALLALTRPLHLEVRS